MENPMSWGLLEQTIADAIQEADRAHAAGVYGPSVIAIIAAKLRSAGLVKEGV